MLEDDSLSLSDSDDSVSTSAEYFPPSESGPKIFKEMSIPSMKFITPTFWVGYRWNDANSSVKISRKYQTREFSLLSWNIRSGIKNTQERLRVLGKYIKDNEPDFIALQEVTPSMLTLLLSQKWITEYYVSDSDPNKLEGNASVVFSTVAFHECVSHDLESRTPGKRVLLGNFLMAQSHPIVLGTFHLEPVPEDIAYRASQLRVIKDLVRTSPLVVLIGDTNFATEGESPSSLGPNFSDAWQTLNTGPGASPGWTFDTTTNEMAREECVKLRIGEKKSRPDRCFYTHNTATPIFMKVLADTQLVSDHYGILVRFKVKEEEVLELCLSDI